MSQQINYRNELSGRADSFPSLDQDGKCKNTPGKNFLNSNISIEKAQQSVMNELGGIPFGRPAEPKEVAELVGFLSSPRADYLSGTQFVIDAGTIPTI